MQANLNETLVLPAVNEMPPLVLLQSLGSRVNKLLSYLTLGKSFGAILGDLGDLAQLQARPWCKVKYTGKVPDATWRWAVGFPGSWANESLGSLGQKASTPGIPYQSLQAALGLYNNENETLQVQQPGVEPVTSGRPQEATADDSPHLFNSSNATNIIYNRKGLPIGTYGLWKAPDGDGMYAVWKLAGFGILVRSMPL